MAPPSTAWSPARRAAARAAQASALPSEREVLLAPNFCAMVTSEPAADAESGANGADARDRTGEVAGAYAMRYHNYTLRAAVAYDRVIAGEAFERRCEN